MSQSPAEYMAKRGIKKVTSNLPRGHHIDLKGSLFAWFGDDLMDELQKRKAARREQER